LLSERSLKDRKKKEINASEIYSLLGRLAELAKKRQLVILTRHLLIFFILMIKFI